MAKQKILMPKLGESVTEGTINTWLISEGDTVEKYDPIAEVTTDKVNAEVPSSYSGTIVEIIAEEGTTVAVDELICYIETKEVREDVPKSEAKREKTPNQAQQTKVKKEKTKQNIEKQARYSPAVLRLATEHNINLSEVEGTGLGGRITRKDLLTLIEQGTVPIEKTTTDAEVKRTKEKIERSTTTQATTMAGDREIPITSIRKTIAENMVRSKEEIPHAWMTVEVDVTDLVALRNRVKDSFKEREGFTLTYFAFFINAVARALKEYPSLNSTWTGDKIIERGDINISIAVAKENELYVPVIKDAADKNITGIAKAIHQLAKKTHEGTLKQSDISDGTFTVNNTGTFGSVSSMGIINYPQAAILQVETIVKRPVIINNMFAARDIVNLSLSLDHRILDGLICGQFLGRVKEILENMNEETVDL